MKIVISGINNGFKDITLIDGNVKLIMSIYGNGDLYWTIMDNSKLIKNMFFTITRENGAPVRVADNLKNEILYNFNSLLAMKRQGINLFFTDIDKIKEKMLNELENDKLHK